MIEALARLPPNLVIRRETPPPRFIEEITEEITEDGYVTLRLNDDEHLLTAYTDRAAVGVIRLSQPFGLKIDHLKISDAYVLRRYRFRGVAQALLDAALASEIAKTVCAAGGVVFTTPIHGPRQEKHLRRTGFRKADGRDLRRWPFLIKAAEPLFVIGQRAPA